MFTGLKICCLLLLFAKFSVQNPEEFGVAANLEDYPFLVYLNVTFYIFVNVRNTPCGGAYIKPSWVLTSGVCLRNFTLFWSRNILDDSMECRMGLPRGDFGTVERTPAIKSKKVFTHPSFSFGHDYFVSNVGLVQLERPFELSPTVALIELPTAAVDLIGKEVTVIGYSTIWYHVSGYIEIPPEFMNLRTITAEVWPRKQCADKHATSDQFCIGGPEEPSWCFDVGGPVLYENMLVGVSGPDINRNSPGEEALNQYIFPYTEWIESTISGNLAGRMMVASVQRPTAIPVVVCLSFALVYLIKFT